MPNNITAIIGQILARGLYVLRSRVLMTRLVNTDWSTEVEKKGKTIDVPISSEKSTSPVVPGATPPEPDDSNISTVPIKLDYWEKTNFGLTDKEMTQIQADKHFIPLEMLEAFEALAAKINQTVFGTYPAIYGAVGTAGTTPFGTGVGTESAINARKVLHMQRAPRESRRGVLDFAAEAQALGLPAMSDAEKVGSGDVKISGEIGTKFGINWNADDAVPTHFSGTLGGEGGGETAIKASTAHDVGAEALIVTVGTTNAMALKQGDIFKVRAMISSTLQKQMFQRLPQLMFPFL